MARNTFELIGAPEFFAGLRFHENQPLLQRDRETILLGDVHHVLVGKVLVLVGAPEHFPGGEFQHGDLVLAHLPVEEEHDVAFPERDQFIHLAQFRCEVLETAGPLGSAGLVVEHGHFAFVGGIAVAAVFGAGPGLFDAVLQFRFPDHGHVFLGL